MPSHTGNSDRLQSLLATNRIRLTEVDWLWSAPATHTLDRDTLWDKVEGMLLGLAIGDALGNTTESLNPPERLELHGEIRDYLPNRYANDQHAGVPSDDTQLAFWTLEQLLADDGLIPDNLADRFTRGRIFGIGANVYKFVRRRTEQRLAWDEAGPESAGNGSLMRIAPVLIPHLRNPTSDLWADAAIASMITHNDVIANASCVAFVSLLWELLGMCNTPDSLWWTREFAARLSGLEGPESCYKPRTRCAPKTESLTRRITATLAGLRGGTTVDVCNCLYSGAYLMETVPCVLYILERHGHDPEEAIVRAVNDTRDNDTIAAIVGAAVGALHGRHALPERWIEGLTGRIGEDDDGRIFRLIEAAKERWG